MTRRFWVGVALTAPLLLIAMSEISPLPGFRSRLGPPHELIHFLLATARVLYCGWPFFERGLGRSRTAVRTCYFIAMGTVFRTFTAWSPLDAGIFPRRCGPTAAGRRVLQTAAAITVLVLFGR